MAKRLDSLRKRLNLSKVQAFHSHLDKRDKILFFQDFMLLTAYIETFHWYEMLTWCLCGYMKTTSKQKHIQRLSDIRNTVICKEQTIKHL